jgi:raffinose/stachyose/melibiose transport system permease protein
MGGGKADGATAGGVSRRRFHWASRWYVVVFISPAFVMVMVFFVIPNLLNFFYAFTNWSSYHSSVSWTGLENFRTLSREGQLWPDLRVTLEYAFCVMVFENSVALVLALALERSTRANGILRSILFLPVLFSTLTAGYIWDGLLQPDGAVNTLLSDVTFRSVHIQWMTSTTWTLLVLALIHSWRFGGIAMIIYIAGLNSVPGELIDSARVEGAGMLRTLRYIKLPLIRPAFTFNLSLSLIGAFSIWELVFATTAGGPAHSTEVLNIFIWQQFGNGLFGFASAGGLVLFMVVCLLGIPMIVYLRRREVVM